MNKISSALTKRRTGFTLTEIAIVLGIIGLILGAIWVAASSVYDNQRVAKASSQLLTIANGTRALYNTSAGTGLTDGTSMNYTLCAAAVIPSDIVSKCTAATTTISDIWGGTTTITSTSTSTSGAGDAIEITMTNIPSANCISLLTSVGGLNHESGLYFASVQSWSATGTETTFPITVATATSTTECTSATKVALNFVFRIK